MQLHTIPDTLRAAEAIQSDHIFRGITAPASLRGVSMPPKPARVHLSHYWLIDGNLPPKVESCGKLDCHVCAVYPSFEVI